MYPLHREYKNVAAEVLCTLARLERAQQEVVGCNRGESDGAWRHRVGRACRGYFSLDHQSGNPGNGPGALGESPNSKSRWWAKEIGGQGPDTEEGPGGAGGADGLGRSRVPAAVDIEERTHPGGAAAVDGTPGQSSDGRRVVARGGL